MFKARKKHEATVFGATDKATDSRECGEKKLNAKLFEKKTPTLD